MIDDNRALFRRFGRERAAQSPPRLVQLGLAGANCAVQARCYFVMLEALDVVEEKDHSITGRQGFYGAPDGQTVDEADQVRIKRAEGPSQLSFRKLDHRAFQ